MFADGLVINHLKLCLLETDDRGARVFYEVLNSVAMSWGV
jgi:hypothetical protein